MQKTIVSSLLVLLFGSTFGELYVKPGNRYPYPRPNPDSEGSSTTTDRPRILQEIYPVYVPYPVFANGFFYGGLIQSTPDDSIVFRRTRNTPEAKATEEYLEQYPLEYIGPIGEDTKPGLSEDLLWKVMKPCKNCAVDRKHVTAKPETPKTTEKPE